MIVFITILVVLIFIGIDTAINLFAWNYFISPIFNLPIISFWQMLGISLIFVIVKTILELILKAILKVLFDNDI